MLDKSLINKISRMVNLFENDNGSPETDYESVYIYRDGNNKRKQTTLGRGFTDDSGNLKKVIVKYIEKNGLLSNMFKKRLTSFGKGTLVNDKEFLKGLTTAGSEQAMKDAQDEIFEEAYLNPALKWAAANGFKLNLSIAVIADSFLHSGRMTPFLMEKFSEKEPAFGGNEKKWIISYLNERLAWFTRSTGLLNTCKFRPSFFLQETKKDNWIFNCPLVVKTKGKIC